MADQEIDQSKTTEVPNDVLHRLSRQRDSAFKRFPLVFILLAAFGLSATSYGFQQLIKKVPILVDNPVITLLAGLLALFLTGTLYKKFS